MSRSRSPAEHVDDGQISRDDVAAVLDFTLHDPALSGTVFEVIAGDDPIEGALAALRTANVGEDATTRVD